MTRIPFAVNKAFNLTQLFSDHNQIYTIDDLDLCKLSHLTDISLYDNPLVYISPFAFTHNPLLSDIDIRSTNLGHIPRALLSLNKLTNVHISGKPVYCSCQEMYYLKSWNVTSIGIEAPMCNSGKSVKSYLTSELPKCP